ncbi:hypothetical protein MVEN_00685500 [Mycena venus]|uniref:Glucose-methanol-choline oxidoreductase C-terminal domain-containing protein n=1 Tax=Mycena venus TaxID=2733690 RepID=A0A8H6YJA3_9AGAR|nr:hypothetical protein MVEN_00685500 [Mycena venus]
MQNTTRFNEAFVEWNRSRTGPLPVFDVHADPSPGPGAPHFEILFQPFGTSGTPGHFISLTVAMVSPVSRGSVTLSSEDPFACIKLALKLVNAPAWNRYLGGPTIDLTAMSPAEPTAHIRVNSGLGYHIIGTASMSPRGAQYGVVDPDLSVKGIARLRVIDASVLPIVPGAHTQAATYVVAERGADMIKHKWT